jgi:hypothetical protein
MTQWHTRGSLLSQYLQKFVQGLTIVSVGGMTPFFTEVPVQTPSHRSLDIWFVPFIRLLERDEVNTRCVFFM